ncbi:MAG: PhoH family protein [Bacteroidales bacterium]
MTDNKEKVFSGIKSLNIDNIPNIINDLYNNGKAKIIDKSLDKKLYENTFIDLGDVIARYKQGYLYKVEWDKRINGVENPTRRQLMALDVLYDDNIMLVSLFGKAGVGKTTLAVNSAVDQAISGSYSKIILSRPKKQRKLDEGFGYLPGELDNKYKPFNAPFYDNLYMQTSLEFETLPLASIQGRSLDDSIWIITEFQDVRPEDTKLIIGRAGKNTKVIIEGDIEQHSDNQLTKKHNGLVHVINELKESKLTATVELDKVKRSPLAKLANKL